MPNGDLCFDNDEEVDVDEVDVDKVDIDEVNVAEVDVDEVVWFCVEKENSWGFHSSFIGKSTALEEHHSSSYHTSVAPALSNFLLLSCLSKETAICKNM